MSRNQLKLEEPLSQFIQPNWDDSIKIHEMFGVEIELEGSGGITDYTNEVINYWNTHPDGSLRKLKPGDEAIEYVFKKPLDYEGTVKAIKVMAEFLNKPHIKVYDSYRTSIHVHVNCLADKMVHIYNFITLSILFDELFVSQNGDHRIGNNFCLRSRDAQGQVEDLISSIRKTGSVFQVDAHHRYSSVNFASLTKFGTIEFRSLECTTDAIRIMRWINTINALKKASRNFENPQDIIRKFSQLSVQEFMFSTLGAAANHYMMVPGYQNMLFDGMRLAQDFAFCSDWVAKQQQEDSPKFGKMKVNKIPIQQQYEQQVAAYQQMVQMVNAQANPAAPPPAPGQWQQWDVEAQPMQGEPVPVEDDDIDHFFDEDDED